MSLNQKLIRDWSSELGFADCGFTNINVDDYIPHLKSWLDAGYSGDMNWIENSLQHRQNPDQLVPNTISVISLRMNYYSPETQALQVLNNPDSAYISRYALGRDYHKLIRKRIAQLADRMKQHLELDDNSVTQRPFVDSAPVLEKPFAEKAGLGWIGKNSLLINNKQGSLFFLGELYTSLQFEDTKEQAANECGKCKACLTICPTDAFPEPYVLDARRCISYLTIEYKGVIEESLRHKIGNRVFGCDDCQLVCPWNRYAQTTSETDFKPRHQLDDSSLLTLFEWNETEFLEKTAGSPIRRAGYESWQRNLAIGLGNGTATSEAIGALTTQRKNSSTMVNEHIDWALNKLQTN